MSLIRLLTAGRSWVGEKNCASRYRAASQGMLPKFGSKKHPFLETSKPGSAPASNGASAAAGRESSELPAGDPLRNLPAPAEGAHIEGAGKAGGKGDEPERHDAKKRSTIALGWSWMDQFATKVAASFVRTPKPTAPVIPRFGSPLVQGELSLDNIKVVRNDLSESDLEVVPAGLPSGQTSAVPASKTMTRPGPAGRAWSRMGSHLFGAGKL